MTTLSPQARLLCAAFVVAVCLVTPVTGMPGLAVVAATVLGWLALCRPPVRTARGTLAFGLVLLSPAMLLTLVIRPGASGWMDAAAAPWSMVGHGLAVMLVSVAATSTLTPSTLRQGLARLPVPEMVAAILLQVVHQSGSLLDETQRVAAAMAVRAGGAGPTSRLRLLAALPGVWLGRVLLRAQRVAAAMELRGLAGADLRALGTRPTTTADVLAVTMAVLALAAAVVLRMVSGG